MNVPPTPSPHPTKPVLICLSHLRWDFVFQRPQHIMTRLAKRYRVLFVEEPVVSDDDSLWMEERDVAPGVRVAVPHIPRAHLSDRLKATVAQRYLLDGILSHERVEDGVVWYYTPLALSFAGHLRPRATVYDCMDELSAFAGAPTEMSTREARLLARADLVLTGGRTLYQAKKHLHANVHCVPSSVDAEHFRRARLSPVEPADQAQLPGPRLGFAGVIDERMDLLLLGGVARARPAWQIIMLGPIAKIDPATLPILPNVHFLGMKSYDSLPAYMSGWDVALLPFARNAATRFISPTKTPEYLAAGRPVVSTSITDVVHPYGIAKLALIADSVPGFVAAVEAALDMDIADLRDRADHFLSQGSWDKTVAKIDRLIDDLDSSVAGHDRVPSARAAV